MESKNVLNAKCLCGRVEYTIADNLLYAGFCHCSQCRRMTGAPFSASGGVRYADLTVNQGRDQLIRYHKNDDSVSHFCQNCGSFIYGDAKKYKMNYVLLGPLDKSPSLKPQWHIYTNYKVDWFDITDDLPQHQEHLVR